MSAPVLTISEQRASISGKKKKKKTVKNILGIPDNLKIECPSVTKSEIAKLEEILNRLLPSARLPHGENQKSNKDSTEHEDVEMIKNAKNNRGQLALGVNSLNKSIKKNLISAVLLADDIQPKFLINHLNLLCHYNKIPFLHVPGLRETMRTHLGFPCIVVGFKTETCHFGEAVDEIKSIFQTKKIILQDENEQSAMESSDSDEVETPNDKICPENNETPFSYLYRSSVKERIFIPERDSLARERTESDFISVKDEAKEINLQKEDSPIGISSNTIKKQEKKSETLKAVFADDEDDLEVPRKKPKKDWFIDKTGTKNCKYYPAKVFKVPSNPNRNWKKNK